MLRRYLAWRQERLSRIALAERALQKAQRTTTSSLAWVACPQELPRPSAGSSFGRPINAGGDAAAVRAYRRGHEAELKEQVARLRAGARADVAAATSAGDVITAANWGDWFREHQAATHATHTMQVVLTNMTVWTSPSVSIDSVAFPGLRATATDVRVP